MHLSVALSERTTTTFHFEKDFQEATRPRPRAEGGRLFAHHVVVCLHKVNSSEIRITYLYTKPRLRRKGFATDCLMWLCELADAYNVNLTLSPTCMDKENPCPDTIRLTQWYQKHGFVRLGYAYEMIRYPHATN